MKNLLLFLILISCSHKNPVSKLNCRIHAEGEYLDFDKCFESENPDGTLNVRADIMPKVTKRLTYSDASRPQNRNKLFSTITMGYMLPDGTAHDVVFFDNGPDYFVGGFARFITKEGKVGFINERLKEAIAGTHDFISPFRDGKANYCDGCVLGGDPEHPEPKGGVWGVFSISDVYSR